MPTKSPFTPASAPSVAGELTADFILQIKGALDAKEALFAKLPAEIAELRKKYEAALLFAPSGFDPEKSIEQPAVATDKPNSVLGLKIVPSRGGKKVWPLPEQKPLDLKTKKTRQTNKESWRSGVLKVLEESSVGLPYAMVLDQARARFGFPHSDGEKGFYNAVARLIKQNAIVKHGSWLYSNKTVALIAKSGGELPPLPEHTRRIGSSPELLTAILEQHPLGLSAPDLKIEVSRLPNAPKSLTQHGQYIYNILGTMIGSGEVIREDGGVYRLVRRVAAK